MLTPTPIFSRPSPPGLCRGRKMAPNATPRPASASMCRPWPAGLFNACSTLVQRLFYALKADNERTTSGQRADIDRRTTGPEGTWDNITAGRYGPEGTTRRKKRGAHTISGPSALKEHI